MNLYIRYFDEECVVESVEQAFEFLASLPGIMVDDTFMNDLRQYVEGGSPYPKRYKVRPRVYFIVIKTTAATLAEFKENGAKATTATPVGESVVSATSNNPLNVQRVGWYEGTVLFKRVLPIPGTNKFQYQDTPFTARLKARSPMDCYTRIINYLRAHEEIDARSQFPSSKGRNFSYTYLGMTLPTQE